MHIYEDQSDKLQHLNYEAFDFVCEHCPQFKKSECGGYEYESDDCICTQYYSQFINKLYEAEQIMHHAIFDVNKKYLREFISNFYGELIKW